MTSYRYYKDLIFKKHIIASQYTIRECCITDIESYCVGYAQSRSGSNIQRMQIRNSPCYGKEEWEALATLLT